MKNWILIAIIVVFPIGLMVGCSSSEENTEPVTQKEAKEEIEEAVEAVASLTQQEMDDFVNQMEGQMQRFEGKIEDLRVEAEALQGDARTAVDEKIEVLEQRQTQASKKLEELKSTGADAWDDVKFGLQSAMMRLNQALQDAASEFEHTG